MTLELEMTGEEVEEFKSEAMELLDEAESHLISLEKGGDFRKTYDAVYRVFHSIKGGAAMLSMEELKSHVHQLETHYQECKNLTKLPGERTTYFLKGVDATRQILNGNPIIFEYSSLTNLKTFQSETNPKTQTQSLSNLSDIKSNLTPNYRVEDIRVMIIDDEIDITDSLRDILSGVGFETFSFTKPQLAIESLKATKPNVVLTDYNMPNMNGLDVLKQVHKYDVNIPVIYLSGYISKELIMESLSHGIFAAIEKPFREEDIIVTCKNAGELHKVVKLLNNTINFIYFQYSDLDQFLQSHGDKELRDQMHSQFRALIDAKRKLKVLRQSPGNTAKF